MIYSATVIKAGDDPNTWIVRPHRVRVDALNYPDQPALITDGIQPQIGDIVLCASSLNGFDQAVARDYFDNGGACPIIIGVFSTNLFRDAIITVLRDMFVKGNLQVDLDAWIKGKTKLGEGTEPMVLGDSTAEWAQSVDAAIDALYQWGATGTGAAGSIPPFPGTPPAPSWSPSNLSEKHTLD